VTRDYHLKIDSQFGKAILLSVFGGKITTFRRLAEEALDKLNPLLGTNKPAWTARATLPGGDIPRGNFEAFLVDAQSHYPWLAPELIKRYAHQFGDRIAILLDGAITMADLGEELSPGLFEREALYLMKYEWAQQADDILWRRTKLGLDATPESIARLNGWMAQQKLASSQTKK